MGAPEVDMNRTFAFDKDDDIKEMLSDVDNNLSKQSELKMTLNEQPTKISVKTKRTPTRTSSTSGPRKLT